jgi:uncharacterized damage-inducible protein DinB
MKKPNRDEYNPYYQPYLDLLDEGEFSHLFSTNTQDLIKLFNSIESSKHEYKYQENKWSIKDVLQHIIDTERGFSYRIIVCIRKDNTTELQPMDEDAYAANVDTSKRTMISLLEEFKVVREGINILIQNASDEELNFTGSNSGHKITARALGHILIGHTIHHCNVIKERYL